MILVCTRGGCSRPRNPAHVGRGTCCIQCARNGMHTIWCDRRAGVENVPSKPRTWKYTIPDEPGAEVTHVADRLGHHWKREGQFWKCMSRAFARKHWTALVYQWSELTDVSDQYK